MWPFKTKQKEQTKHPKEQAIEKLKAFRDIGQKFQYMGIEMIVEAHWEWDSLPVGLAPRIVAAYKNDHGELKHAFFNVSELPALRAENP